MSRDIASQVNRVIQEKGYKQYVIAERAGFTAKEFSDLLNGRKIFKAEYVKPICFALEITPDTLFGFSENYKKT